VEVVSFSPTHTLELTTGETVTLNHGIEAYLLTESRINQQVMKVTIHLLAGASSAYRLFEVHPLKFKANHDSSIFISTVCGAL